MSWEKLPSWLRNRSNRSGDPVPLAACRLRPRHMPASSSASRSRLRRSCAPGGGAGTWSRTGATHQCAPSFNSPATHRLPGGAGMDICLIACPTAVVTSQARASGTFAASGTSPPEPATSHTPTVRPPMTALVRRRTSSVQRDNCSNVPASVMLRPSRRIQ